MAFSVIATPSSFVIGPGGSQDVVFAFDGVPPELTDNALIPFQLGSESVTVALAVTLDEPDPSVGSIVVPGGITATVLSVDDTQAVVNFARS